MRAKECKASMPKTHRLVELETEKEIARLTRIPSGLYSISWIWTRKTRVKTIDDTVQMIFKPTGEVQHSQHPSFIGSRQLQRSKGRWKSCRGASAQTHCLVHVFGKSSLKAKDRWGSRFWWAVGRTRMGLLAFPLLWTGLTVSSICSSVPKIATYSPAMLPPDDRHFDEFC